MAWCYLTLMLEGSALDEMDMVPDKNAYAVWQHLNGTYEPKGRKANDHQKMKFVQCKLEPQEEANDFLEKEIDVMDADEHGDEDEEAYKIFGSNSGDRVKSEQSMKRKRQFSFQCHQEKYQHQQHGMKKVLVKTSDQMVVPNGVVEKGKQHTIMEDSMLEKVVLQSHEEKQIEQQEGRYGKRHKEDNTNGIDLWEENIEAGEWGVVGRKKDYHQPVVKDKEENPTREKNQESHQGLSVEPRETDAEPSGDDKHAKENHEEFSG